MWLILLLLLCLPVLTFMVKNSINASRYKYKRLPPGPRKLPIIGNLHQMGSLPGLSRTYGPVMLLHLGGTRLVVVSSAEAAREALKTHDLECCSRPFLVGAGMLSYNYLDLAFAPYGDHWRELRRICVLNLFSLKSVESFRCIREEETSSLVDSLRLSSSHPVNLSEKMFAHTASITFRVAFGKTFGESGLDDEKFQEMVHRGEGALGSFSASDFFPYFGWIIDRLTGVNAKLKRSFRELDTLFERVIEEHLSKIGQQEHEDIVDLLLKLERDQSEYMGHGLRMSKDCAKALLMNIFLAGIDTTAIVVTWAMAELLRNPKIMKKAQDEIRSCVKNGKLVREDDIHQLQYLKMVVKETLRLHPPGPLLLPRETISEFNLLDYKIPPKTLLQVNVRAIGRDPNYWANPEDFFPERFSDQSIDYKGQHFELLPFGAGRRGCPGIRMGLAVVELVLANLLGCFDWKLPDGMKETDIDMEEAYGLTAFKKSDLNLIPITYQLP